MSGAYYHHQPPPPSSSYYPPPVPPPQPPPPPHLSYYPPPPPPPPPIPGVGLPHHHHPPPPPPYYNQYHQPPPPPPPPHYSLPQSENELRTLFIAGLPDDVQAREIYNLFRDFPGFESSQLRAAGNTRAFAFSVFTDQQSAVTAMNALNGLVFDLEKESTLYINLAKSNSRIKRSRTDDGSPYSPDKKFRGSIVYSRGFHDAGVGSNNHMPGIGNSAYSINGYPSTQSHSAYDSGTTDPNKSLNNNPCSTLFVANLGPTCSEQELTEVFSRCPGFLKLKMRKKNGLPVAFVDFQDVASSTGALNHLQGTLVYSSNGEGMRLEYAKSRMGLPGREKRA